MMMGPDSPPASATDARQGAFAAGAAADARLAPDALEAATLTFKIVSRPPGAALYEGSRLYCEKTPCEYIAPANNDKIVLVAHLDGYDDAEFNIIPLVEKKRAKDMTITVPLTKPKKGPAKVLIKKGPGDGGGGQGGTAGGDLGGNPYPQ
jgi:hypothetical protein